VEKKTLLIIGLLSLLLSTSMVYRHFSIIASAAATLHVYPGNSIQQALNSAQNGDVIFVHNGTYAERIVLNKTVSLIGISNPLIQVTGSGSVVTINASNVVFNGFTIERIDDHSNWDNGVSITGISTGCNVTENKITNNHYGIFVNASANYVYGNNITENTVGIGIENSSNNLVSANNVNRTGGGGICLLESSNNTVSFNKVENNRGCGIGLFFSAYNTIFGNNLTSFRDIGILLSLSSDNNVSSNNIEDNLSDYGIKLQCSSNNNSISGNYINKNQYGIYVVDSPSTFISANKIISNSFGVILGSPSNIVTTNNFANNEVGVKILSSSNTLHHNNFINNINQTYLHKPSYSNSWDNGYPSGGNYWNDYVGTDANGDGIGDIPYTINENNTDRYPLMSPYGASPPTTPTPTPTPTPTSQPTTATTPIPETSPKPSPSASPQESTPSPKPEPHPETFPTTIVAAPIASVAFIGVGLLVYFKKRKH